MQSEKDKDHIENPSIEKKSKEVDEFREEIRLQDKDREFTNTIKYVTSHYWDYMFKSIKEVLSLLKENKKKQIQENKNEV